MFLNNRMTVRDECEILALLNTTDWMRSITGLNKVFKDPVSLFRLVRQQLILDTVYKKDIKEYRYIIGRIPRKRACLIS